MKLFIFILTIPTLLSLASQAEVPAFKKGDRVTFIGDSITHGGSYHPNVYLYYATRFPTQPFAAYNCGISGDTAPGTNKRFEMDIAVHKPNVATIMLGMNDAWAWCFDTNGPPQNLVNGPISAFDTYAKEMDVLATSLKELDADIIFITPSIYDQTAEGETKNLVGKNDLLGKFSAYIKEIAPRYDASVIDFYSLMNQVNAKLQAKDPSATIVGKDRVHPGAQGHFVMSYAFLKAQGMPSLVSSIQIDAKNIGNNELKNCSIDKIKQNPKSISFDCLEKALPFPITQGQTPALDWVPFQEELNQQLFSVKNLSPGNYELKIDKTHIDTFSAEELSQGINLSQHENTPQYRQASLVRGVHGKRLAATAKLRSIMHVRHTMLSKIEPPLAEDDLVALKTLLMEHVEKSKGESWYPYIKSQAKAFLENLAQEEALKHEEEDYMRKVWMVNQPQTHHWQLIAL